MQQTLLMDVIQAVEQRQKDIFQGGFRRFRVFLHPTQKRLAPDEFHHHVGGSLLLQKTKNTDNVGMVELGKGSGLLDKSLLSPGKDLIVGLPLNLDAQILGADYITAGQQFLNGYVGCQARVMGKIGDAEPSLSQDANDPVFLERELGR